MTDQVHTPATLDYGAAVATPEERNRVLRNTYWLLTLSLLPTVLGAWIGLATGFATLLKPGISLILFLIGSFAFIHAIEKNRHSWVGVGLLLGFTFFMGLMLSRLLAMILDMKTGSAVVMQAFGGTAAVFFAMASLSTVIKRDLSGMYKWLFAGALVVFVAAIINVFTQSGPLMLAICVIAIGVFSMFMLWQLKQVIDGGETNYVTATLTLYLSAFNVFQSLLILFGIGGDD